MFQIDKQTNNTRYNNREKEPIKSDCTSICQPNLFHHQESLRIPKNPKRDTPQPERMGKSLQEPQ